MLYKAPDESARCRRAAHASLSLRDQICHLGHSRLGQQANISIDSMSTCCLETKMESRTRKYSSRQLRWPKCKYFPGSQELSKIPMDKLERRFTTYQKFALVTSAHHHIWIYLGVSAEILEPRRNSWYYAAISTHQCVSIPKTPISTHPEDRRRQGAGPQAPLHHGTHAAALGLQVALPTSLSIPRHQVILGKMARQWGTPKQLRKQTENENVHLGHFFGFEVKFLRYLREQNLVLI